MYFSVPSVLHVTSGFAGSSTIPAVASGSPQFNAARADMSSGVTQFWSVVLVGFAVGVAGLSVPEPEVEVLPEVLDSDEVADVELSDPDVLVAAARRCDDEEVSEADDVDALELPEVLEEPVEPSLVLEEPVEPSLVLDEDGVPAVGVGTGVVGSATSTGRNCRADERRRFSSCWRVGFSGIETTILSAPCVVTSDPDTPCESTRSAMMSRACATCSLETVWSPTSRGLRISCVPPCRSRPSFGANCASLRQWAPPSTAPSATMSRMNPIKVRFSTSGRDVRAISSPPRRPG
ncbi:hypothetical protein GCM10009811_01630 [Nostocoides veronense]|uniref:Secreted protein n=1 Tax=Nostocoides veronense TaxID=330836 RepID=A0ABN2L9S0_9MICO